MILYTRDEIETVINQVWDTNPGVSGRGLLMEVSDALAALLVRDMELVPKLKPFTGGKASLMRLDQGSPAFEMSWHEIPAPPLQATSVAFAPVVHAMSSNETQASECRAFSRSDKLTYIASAVTCQACLKVVAARLQAVVDEYGVNSVPLPDGTILQYTVRPYQPVKAAATDTPQSSPGDGLTATPTRCPTCGQLFPVHQSWCPQRD